MSAEYLEERCYNALRDELLPGERRLIIDSLSTSCTKNALIAVHNTTRLRGLDLLLNIISYPPNLCVTLELPRLQLLYRSCTSQTRPLSSPNGFRCILEGQIDQILNAASQSRPWDSMQQPAPQSRSSPRPSPPPPLPPPLPQPQPQHQAPTDRTPIAEYCIATPAERTTRVTDWLAHGFSDVVTNSFDDVHDECDENM
jgi:hypothetical protein